MSEYKPNLTMYLSSPIESFSEMMLHAYYIVYSIFYTAKMDVLSSEKAEGSRPGHFLYNN